MRTPLAVHLRTIAFLLAAVACACGGAVTRGGGSTSEADRGAVEPGEGSPGGARDPRCLPQGGYADDACDLCENAGCCAAKFDCYDDRACGAVADELEACVPSVNGDAARIAACWSTFTESGERARARVDGRCPVPQSFPST